MAASDALPMLAAAFSLMVSQNQGLLRDSGVYDPGIDHPRDLRVVLLVFQVQEVAQGIDDHNRGFALPSQLAQHRGVSAQAERDLAIGRIPCPKLQAVLPDGDRLLGDVENSLADPQPLAAAGQ